MVTEDFCETLQKNKIRNVEQKSRTNPLRRAKKEASSEEGASFFVRTCFFIHLYRPKSFVRSALENRSFGREALAPYDLE